MYKLHADVFFFFLVGIELRASEPPATHLSMVSCLEAAVRLGSLPGTAGLLGPPEYIITCLEHVRVLLSPCFIIYNRLHNYLVSSQMRTHRNKVTELCLYIAIIIYKRVYIVCVCAQVDQCVSHVYGASLLYTWNRLVWFIVHFIQRR